MSEPITDRDLPEELMSALLRYEEEAYRAGQHGCCEEKGTRHENPSVWKACETHGPRCRAALSLLCHELAAWAEDIVEEAAKVAENTDPVEIGTGYMRTDDARGTLADAAQAIRALAPPCPKCRGAADTRTGYCDCSRGKGYAHWAKLTATPAPASPAPSEEAPAAGARCDATPNPGSTLRCDRPAGHDGNHSAWTKGEHGVYGHTNWEPGAPSSEAGTRG